MDAEIIKSGAWKGHVALLFAHMIWGFMSPISKSVLLSGEVSAIALSTLRIGGGAFLFLIMGPLLPRSIAPREHIDRSDWPMIFLAGLVMIALNQGLFITGVAYTSPLDATVMATTTPIITLILATIFLSMPMTLLKVIGVAIGLGGALLLVFTGHTGSRELAPNPALGNTMVFVAQVCASIYYVFFMRLIRKYAPWTLMKWMFICAAVVYIPATYPWWSELRPLAMSTPVVLGIAYVVVLSTFLTYLLLPFAQRLLKPTVVSMYTYFQPVFSAALSAILGIAVFGVDKIIATVLILVGVGIVTRSPGPRIKPSADTVSGNGRS